MNEAEERVHALANDPEAVARLKERLLPAALKVADALEDLERSKRSHERRGGGRLTRTARQDREWMKSDLSNARRSLREIRKVLELANRHEEEKIFPAGCQACTGSPRPPEDCVVCDTGL